MPSGQSVQLELLVALANEPAAQTEHCVEPWTAVTWPTPHGVHKDDAVVDENEPVGQSEQADDALGAYEPAGHGAQPDAFAVGIHPGRHC